MEILREPVAPKYLRVPEYSPMWEIAANIDKCDECYLCDMPHVLWRGNPYARIAVVGQCPGKQEHHKGIPWCGPAGHLLDKAFASVDMDTNEDAFITNIVKARPIAPAQTGKENLDPSAEAARICSRFVQRELEAINYLQVIILAGKVAAVGMNAADSNEPMYRIAGKVRSIPIGGRDIPAVTIYHTAALLHNRDPKRDKEMRWSIYNSLKTVKEIAFCM